MDIQTPNPLSLTLDSISHIKALFELDDAVLRYVRTAAPIAGEGYTASDVGAWLARMDGVRGHCPGHYHTRAMQSLHRLVDRGRLRVEQEAGCPKMYFDRGYEA